MTETNDSPVKAAKERVKLRKQEARKEAASSWFASTWNSVKDVIIRSWRIIGALSICYLAFLVLRASGLNLEQIVLSAPAMLWAAYLLLKR